VAIATGAAGRATRRASASARDRVGGVLEGVDAEHGVEAVVRSRQILHLPGAHVGAPHAAARELDERPGPFALSAPGALEDFAAVAGLRARGSRDVDCPFEYPDEATALRALLSVGPAVKAIRHAGGDAVRRAVREASAPYRTAAGGYRIANRWRFVVAAA
jgi:hypothetical protein